jgi:hypothetical protein
MQEHDPVEDWEFVYRRIHRVYIDRTLPILVRREAFRPNQMDSTGLSVFRARFVQPLDTLANIAAEKAKHYYVAPVAVQALQDLGLTVTPDPVPGGPLGHAIIPELSWPAYQARKQHCKSIILALAKLASADIVHSPS